MEITFRFVGGKGNVPDVHTKPFAAHWFPGNGMDGGELNTAILFLHLENFATLRDVACKQRAEWTFSAEPETLESRPTLSTVRVTDM
jgi:hypothetical protein